MDPLTRMQDLLRDLFQLDTADLDFGLYHLLHLKRAEIEAFITEQLPRRVDESFRQLSERERQALAERAQHLQGQIRMELGEGAILADGSVAERYRQPNGRSLRELVATYETERQKLAQVQATEAQKAEVFNHLYAFFSRYYEDGDFIPQRRYGASETYAVPYNGEEVLLHWANKGQHYVKSGERLRDYAFTVEALGGPYRVRFALTEATTPRENTKGDTRYFFPRPEAATYEDKTFTLPFEYRLPTEEEIEQYGRNAKGQEAILQEALDPILAAVPEDTLAVALGQVVQETEKEQVTRLLRHLRHFTRRQTSDYFVHPDLKGFLTRELEFYLKDQALHLADLDPDVFPARLRVLQVIRQLGEDVIEFLDQMEQVQCRLFEKKKFVLRTDYLCTVQHVPRDLWPEVLANEAQRAEWQRLFATEGPVDEAFLETHPTLVVNTAHFDEGFTLRLLAAFDDIDEATDGLLVHGENYQALHLLQERYRGQVKCIYIDPPYNTGSDEFIYKDRYQHSSWLAMVAERLRCSLGFLTDQTGVTFINIDDNELVHVCHLVSSLLVSMETLVWNKAHKRYGKMKNTSTMRGEHDYVVAGYFGSPALNRVPVFPRFSQKPKTDGRGRYYTGYIARGEQGSNPDHENYYTVTSPSGQTFSAQFSVPRGEFERLDRDNRIHWTDAGIPYSKIYLHEPRYVRLSSVLNLEKATTYDANKEFAALSTAFAAVVNKLNPKPTKLVATLLHAGSCQGDTIADFFAGSGTTGHAVINLNREDGGRRRFLLVEMADYFDTVLLPRIQKVMYCPDWKDGKPKGYPQPSLEGLWPEWVERTPRLVKVIRLEGYEDALHNLVTEETLAREQKRAAAYKEVVGAETYRLRYLVRLPLEASTTMLAAVKLDHPFRYTLEVLTEEGPATRPVDLVETFNYLVGLRVRRVETWRNAADGREYRAVSGEKADGKRVLVLWRDSEGLAPETERTFLEGKVGGYDEVFVNGDCAVKRDNVASLDPLFKRLMMAGESGEP